VLAVLVALFAVTRLSTPAGDVESTRQLSFPVSLFARGIGYYATITVVDHADPDCAGAEPPGISLDCSTEQVPGRKVVDIAELKQRELVAFGSAAVVVVLLGLAAGAVGRSVSPSLGDQGNGARIASVNERISYVVTFANGEGERAGTLEEARDIVMRRTGFDQAPPELLPAEIREIGPNDVGAGRLVESFPRA
jgi:hypothetical protein